VRRNGPAGSAEPHSSTICSTRRLELDLASSVIAGINTKIGPRRSRRPSPDCPNPAQSTSTRALPARQFADRRDDRRGSSSLGAPQVIREDRAPCYATGSTSGWDRHRGRSHASPELCANTPARQAMVVRFSCPSLAVAATRTFAIRSAILHRPPLHLPQPASRRRQMAHPSVIRNLNRINAAVIPAAKLRLSKIPQENISSFSRNSDAPEPS